MKAVCKKLFSLMLVAILLVSAVPFQVSADETQETTTETTTTVETTAAVETTEAAETTASTETTANPAPASLGNEAGAQIPSLTAEVVPTDKIYVEYQIQWNGGEYRIGNLVESKIGQRLNTPSQNNVMEVLRTVKGSSEGYRLVRWELADGTVVDDSTIINLAMHFDTNYTTPDRLLKVYAIVQTDPKTIGLNAAGGNVSSSKHTVEVSAPYNRYGDLPIPTRGGYSFAGWFKPDGTRVDNNTIVTDLDNLTAYWTTGRYNVTFQANTTGTAWADVAEYTFRMDNGAILKPEYNNFPTDAAIKSLFALSGWTIDGWEYTNDGNSGVWKEFKSGTTKIVGDTLIRPVYKKNITLYACDAGNTTRSLQVTLGKNFPILPHPGTRENYAFVGWYMEAAAQNLVSSKDNLSNVSAHPIVQSDIQALYAGWDNAKIVYLYIHTNGNTKEHTKLVRYYDVPKSGFDLTDIDLYDIFPNYGNYDDKNDEKWGWYNEAQWENFCMNKHKYETTEYVDADYLKKDDVHEFYIMLINNGTTNNNNNNNYNDNKNTVDSSNPTTGDDIFVAVTVMAVSACAVLLIFMNKKRFTK